MFLTADLASAFEARGSEPVQQAASQVLGRPIQVKAVVGGTGQAPTANQPAPADVAALPNESPAEAAPAGKTSSAAPDKSKGAGSAPAKEPGPPPPAGPPEDDDVPSPDDPAAGVRALTGVPLVMEMLGGEVVEELTED
jgi:hypothetical protein